MEIKVEECTARLESTLRANKRLLGIEEELRSRVEILGKREESSRKEIDSLKKWKRNWEGVVDEWKK